MADIPYSEPSQIRAGDTIAWKRALSDYPAGTWVLVYTLINSAHKYTVTCTADGLNHLARISAATSANMVAGWYDWMARVGYGGAYYDVGHSRLQVLPNLSAATTLDNRSHARKMLEAIEAALERRATAQQLDMLTMAIGDRNSTRDPEKLLKIRDRYRAEVAAEDIADKLRNGKNLSNRRIQTRFT